VYSFLGFIGFGGIGFVFATGGGGAGAVWFLSLKREKSFDLIESNLHPLKLKSITMDKKSCFIEFLFYYDFIFFKAKSMPTG
jgi:hypothetical protein